MRYGKKLSYNFRKWLVIATFSVVLISLFILPIVNAQTEGESKTTLAVSPVIFELAANPGDSIENSIKVSNPHGTESIAVSMEIKPFTGTETGNAIILDTDDPAYTFQEWFSFSPKSFVLQPKEEQIVEVTINIPKNAEPGGRYASILASSGTGEFAGTGAATVQKVGSLILLRVNGTISYTATVKNFQTVANVENEELADVAEQFNYEGNSVNFLTRITNTGASHIKPEGFIIISDIFGNKVVDVPFPARNILPGNDRLIGVKWEEAKIGYYTATLFLNYGDKDGQITATTTFMVFPWKTGVPLIIGVLVILWFLIARRGRVSKALSVIFGKH